MATWTGGAGTTNWTDPNNWSPAANPNGAAVTIAYTSANQPVTVNIANDGTTYAESALTLGISSATQSITLNNAGVLNVNNGIVLLYAGSTLSNTGHMDINNGSQTLFAGSTISNSGSMIINGTADIFGTITDTGVLTINNIATIETGGHLNIGPTGSVAASQGIAMVNDGAMLVQGTLTMPSGILGGGAMTVDGGNVSGGFGNPLQIGSASISFTISNGGTLNVSQPSSTDSFNFGADSGSTPTLSYCRASSRQ